MEELTWTERREASFLEVLEASCPQAPNDSTTRGMQLQPSSAQIPEFACIFRSSVAKAAEPAVCPASETMSGFSFSYFFKLFQTSNKVYLQFINLAINKKLLYIIVSH